MQKNTEYAYEGCRKRFQAWLLTQPPQMLGAIKDMIGANGITTPRRPNRSADVLTPQEIEKSWLVITKDWPREALILRIIYRLGVEPAFLLGDGREYVGVCIEDFRQWPDGEATLVIKRRGGIDTATRLPQWLWRMIKEYIGNRHSGKLFPVMKAAAWMVLRKQIIPILEEQRLIRSGLRGGFKLWRQSPLLRLYDKPPYRDGREPTPSPVTESEDEEVSRIFGMPEFVL